MRQKIRKGKLEACKLVWKKRITAEWVELSENDIFIN